MPLIKSSSKDAIRKNIKAEAKNKPVKQVIAIALSVARKATSEKKKKKHSKKLR